MESSSFYQKMGHHPFRQTFWHGKLDLREECGGSKLGKKEFQYFQLL